jgi:hypothetical protein
MSVEQSPGKSVEGGVIVLPLSRSGCAARSRWVRDVGIPWELPLQSAARHRAAGPRPHHSKTGLMCRRGRPATVAAPPSRAIGNPAAVPRATQAVR